MIWLDAHLSPRVARWIQEELGHEARHLREVALRDADDDEIFKRARKENVVLISKDKDFADMAARFGPPPAVIWLRCGNTSEERLKQILAAHLEEAIEFIAKGETIVEIR
ncbi:MAG: DUF5615 family PIN-like protein [Puniceicoccaceae bacterium]